MILDESKPMAERVLALEKGEQFIVKTTKLRFAAMTAKRELRNANILKTTIVTRPNENGEFIIAAI